MLITIVGGKLQGVEAVYLAQKAGWKTLLIDKNRYAPATGLCDDFLEFEFTLEYSNPPVDLKVDLIIPAIEDDMVLRAVTIWAKDKQIPLAFDLNAYSLSSSKLKSEILFKEMGLPVPKPWPDCGFPLIVKPDDASGSLGVEIFHDSRAFRSRIANSLKIKDLIIQEYLTGPSYSIEVIGGPAGYKSFQVTDLHMDDTWDCKRVTAPTQLSLDRVRRFKKMSVAIAKAIDLNGIMDVEVIFHEDDLKLLEIDARLPSQTPMAVYWSTGVNLVEQLASSILNTQLPDPGQVSGQFVIVEHIKISGSDLKVLGEHIMGMEGPLSLKTNFWGADEAITSYSQGNTQWVSTLIFRGETREDVYEKKNICHERILRHINHSLTEGQTQ